MPHPNAIEPGWVIQYCPFCYFTITLARGDDSDGLVAVFPDREQVWDEHLAEHVEEMMAVTTR